MIGRNLEACSGLVLSESQGNRFRDRWQQFKRRSYGWKAVATLGLSLIAPHVSWAGNGLIAVKSPHSVKVSVDRFEAAAKARGLTVFLRLDHAAGAKKIGKELRPTALLVFGNPQGGTPLMECSQTAGIDLPLKALAWQDQMGQVWLGYNDPRYLAGRHGAGECGPVVQDLSKALAGLAQEAVK